MIRECFKTNSGIIFHSDGLKEIGIDPHTLYPKVLPRPPAIQIDSTASNPKVFISPIPKSQPTPGEIGQATIESLKKTEEELELDDSLAPLYDELRLNWLWWILEVIPLRHKIQTSDNKWVHTFGWNLGTGRHVPRQSSVGVKVHRSVKTRLDAEYKDGRKYWPKADLDLKYVTWVDWMTLRCKRDE